MKKQTRKIALGALFTALGVTLMLLGAAIGIGTYAAPMLAGLLLLPLGARYGTKYQLTVFAATALLSLLPAPGVSVPSVLPALSLPLRWHCVPPSAL